MSLYQLDDHKRSNWHGEPNVQDGHSAALYHMLALHHPLNGDQPSGYMYWIPGLEGIKFEPHQVSAISFNMGRWVWNSDIPGVLVTEDMCLGETFTSLAVAMICKSQTEKVVLGLLQWMLGGNTFHEWVLMAQNNYPGNIGEELVWYPLKKLISETCHLLVIETTSAASAKWIFVTGSLRECLGVVAPESQGDQISEVTGMLWLPSGEPGSTGKNSA